MKERPILFSAPMVRAILSGQKTVTRRVVKGMALDWLAEDMFTPEYVAKHSSLCPYGLPGDRLWVRETWAADAQLDAIAPRDLSQGEPILYPADDATRTTGCAMISPGKSRPSIHMPRWASRILLEITEVRVERLQCITEQQALAEGVAGCEESLDPDGNSYSPAELFSMLWSSISGTESWHANPWVWVIEFRRVAL